MFQAERHTTGSNYKLTLAGFFFPKSICTSTTQTVATSHSTITSGQFNVRLALAAANLQSDPPYLRVTAVMASGSDRKTAPTLTSFDVTYTCVNVE